MTYRPGFSIMAQLIDRAAEAGETPRRVITGNSRDRRTCRVRYAIIYCGHQYGLSSVQIGQGLNRDHTTILDGIKRAEELLKSDPTFPALINAIEFKQERIAA